MKFILLAAAAILATPALAQTTTPSGGDTMSAPAQSSSTPAGDPVGGYQPSAPPMSGPMQPGATVTFQAAQSPDQAYPAPAPMAKYPMCKPGQFDKCMQGAGSTHSRQVHRKKM